MSESLKKGVSECMPVGQKKPQKTNEATQRPSPVSTKVSEEGKGSFTIKK